MHAACQNRLPGCRREGLAVRFGCSGRYRQWAPGMAGIWLRREAK